MNTEAVMQSAADMQRLLDSKRIEYAVWCNNNKNAQGTELYESYTGNFRNWEREILSTIKEVQRNEQSTVPIGRDLDAQLHDMLCHASMEEFILAFLHVNSKDKTVLQSVCKALGIEYAQQPAQPPMPVAMNYPTSSVPRLPQQRMPYLGHVQQHQVVPNRVQTTPYGNIPENWTVDPPVMRVQSLAPPPKTYAESTKLPFFDIGSAPR